VKTLLQHPNSYLLHWSGCKCKESTVFWFISPFFVIYWQCDLQIGTTTAWAPHKGKQVTYACCRSKEIKSVIYLSGCNASSSAEFLVPCTNVLQHNQSFHSLLALLNQNLGSSIHSLHSLRYLTVSGPAIAQAKFSLTLWTVWFKPQIINS
jgi:hypothetical protein